MNSIETISPLNYVDFRKFLSDLFTTHKSNKGRYSYRQFAHDLGFGKSNFLHLVISGERNLSPESTRNIAASFSWSAKEKRYFQMLVLLNQCASEGPEKEKLKHALDKILKKDRFILPEYRFDYFSRWYYPIIREVIALEGFVPNLDWIARKIKIPIDHDQLLESIHTLERIGMIEKVAGGWRQKEEHVTTDKEVSSDIVMIYHEELLHLSRKALSLAPEERDFSSMTMSLSEKQFEWLKKRLGEFRDEIQNHFQSAEEPSQHVAQLNMQLFNLTNSRSKIKSNR